LLLLLLENVLTMLKLVLFILKGIPAISRSLAVIKLHHNIPRTGRPMNASFVLIPSLQCARYCLAFIDSSTTPA
jgi:hypothetical protein